MARPRRAALPAIIHALRAPVGAWDGSAIGASPKELGLKGSPTWVPDVANIQMQRKAEVLKGDPAVIARTLVEKLKSAGVIEG